MSQPANGVRYSVAERAKTLMAYVGRVITVTSARTLHVECDSEAALIEATVAMQNAAGILRVSACTREVQGNSFTVELSAQQFRQSELPL